MLHQNYGGSSSHRGYAMAWEGAGGGVGQRGWWWRGPRWWMWCWPIQRRGGQVQNHVKTKENIEKKKVFTQKSLQMMMAMIFVIEKSLYTEIKRKISS